MWRVHSQDELVRRGKAVRDQLIAAILSGKLNETQATWAIWAVGHIDKKNNNNEEQWNIEKFADNQWSLNGKANNNYKLNIRIQATRILGETEISAATPKLIKLLSDEEPRIRLAAIGSLDRIGWGNNSDTILEAIAYETDRVTFYSNWQVMRRHLSKEKRYALLKEEQIGLQRMAALSLMEEGDRDLQKRADEILGNAITFSGNPLKKPYSVGKQRAFS